MNGDLAGMVRPDGIRDVNEASNIMKQAVQEIILFSLSGSGFFDHAVFHGGTCLRILHGLDRFSEDLDFSLDASDPSFDFGPYAERIVLDLAEMGVAAEASLRPPRGELNVFSCKIKANLKAALVTAGFDKDLIRQTNPGTLMVVKIDIDLDPPDLSRDEDVLMDGALQYHVRAETLPVLFAGKTAAVLCRHWVHRVKGRDLYDFRWYIENGIPLDLECLASRVGKKCGIDAEDLDRDRLVGLLDARFDALDWSSAEEDVINFVTRSQIRDWGPEPFKELARWIKVLE